MPKYIMLPELGPVTQIDRGRFDEVFDYLAFVLSHNATPGIATESGTFIKLERMLGQGGTRTVFDCAIDGEQLALALPNIHDGVTTAAHKWQKALREPPVTDVLRGMDFQVNTHCGVTPIHVNGVSFPAITLHRYQDLPFIDVRDHTDSRSSIISGSLMPSNPTLKDLFDLTDGLVRDTVALVENGVVLAKEGDDSFNLCREKAGDNPRLFLNDLGDTIFRTFTEEEAVKEAIRIAPFAFGALVRGVDVLEYLQEQDFFDREVFDGKSQLRNDSPAFQRFTRIVLGEAGFSS